jgi:hypothetical protein
MAGTAVPAHRHTHHEACRSTGQHPPTAANTVRAAQDSLLLTNLEGTLQQILLSNGLGVGTPGYHDEALVARLHHWQDQANELSDSLKLTAVSANVLRKRFGGHHLAKAYNLAPGVRAAYDAALEQFDLLMMPTVPMKAQPIPPRDAPLAERIQRAFEAAPNVQRSTSAGTRRCRCPAPCATDCRSG